MRVRPSLYGPRSRDAAETSIAATGADGCSAQAAFVHRVTAGGPDICLLFDLHPGCDGNLSLIVLQRSDGSLTAQGEDALGDHLTIDCLEVE